MLHSTGLTHYKLVNHAYSIKLICHNNIFPVNQGPPVFFFFGVGGGGGYGSLYSLFIIVVITAL